MSSSEPYVGPDRRASEYTGPERRVMEQERILRLEAATRHLASQVQGLSAALSAVNRISARQQQLEQETRVATAALAAVGPRVDRLAGEVIPRAEHRSRDQERWIITGGAVLFAIHAHEITRNACGGHRLDLASSPETVGGVRQTACDIFWPEATGQVGYPSTANVVGFVVYLLLFYAAVMRLRQIRRSTIRHEGERQRLDDRSAGHPRSEDPC